jgi:hypothetical protein
MALAALLATALAARFAPEPAVLALGVVLAMLCCMAWLAFRHELWLVDATLPAMAVPSTSM